MNLSEALPLIGMVAGAVASYWGAHTAMRVEIVRLEERLKALQDAHASDHARLNDLVSEFNRETRRQA